MGNEVENPMLRDKWDETDEERARREDIEAQIADDAYDSRFD